MCVREKPTSIWGGGTKKRKEKHALTDFFVWCKENKLEEPSLYLSLSVSVSLTVNVCAKYQHYGHNECSHQMNGHFPRKD